MARKYEGSPADEAEDKRGMKATGMSKKAYEASPRDKAEDKAGEDRIKVGAHSRKRPAPKMPPAPPAAPSFGLAEPPGADNAPQPDDEDLEGGM